MCVAVAGCRLRDSVQGTTLRSISNGTASSVAVKLDGVDCGGDGPAAVASPLLLCLLVSEGLALCVLEHVVCFLAPVPVCSPLQRTDKQVQWATCDMFEQTV